MPVPEWLHEADVWRDLSSKVPGVAGIVQVTSTRTVRDNTSKHTRYFLTRLPLNAERALRAARFHWGIENGLHWVLDLAFDEDSSRAHLKNA